jgi:hypothetical protein
MLDKSNVEDPPVPLRDRAYQGSGKRLDRLLTTDKASWRSGYAAACKAVYTGSIPVDASLRRPSRPNRPRAGLDPRRSSAPSQGSNRCWFVLFALLHGSGVRLLPASSAVPVRSFLVRAFPFLAAVFPFLFQLVLLLLFLAVRLLLFRAVLVVLLLPSFPLPAVLAVQLPPLLALRPPSESVLRSFRLGTFRSPAELP